jgi:hypothetical protein
MLKIIIGLLLILSSNALAECQHIKSTIGSASIFSNLMNSKRSLRYELTESIMLAHMKSKESPFKRVQVLVTPNKTLNKYRKMKTCEELHRKSSLTPNLYVKRYKNVEDFQDWFIDFSQGDNDDGEKLYEECPDLCSLSYKVLLQFGDGKDGGPLDTHVEATCGAARDRNENNYLIHGSICN